MDITDLFYVLKYPMNCFLVQICIQNTCAMRSSIIVMPNRWYLQTNDCQNEEQWTITFMEVVVIIWTVKVRQGLSRFKHSSNDLILLFYHRQGCFNKYVHVMAYSHCSVLSIQAFCYQLVWTEYGFHHNNYRNVPTHAVCPTGDILVGFLMSNQGI